jgi:hypothetical protein
LTPGIIYNIWGQKLKKTTLRNYFLNHFTPAYVIGVSTTEAKHFSNQYGQISETINQKFPGR